MRTKKIVLLLTTMLTITFLISGCNKNEKIIDSNPQLETPTTSSNEDIEDEPLKEEPQAEPEDITAPPEDTLSPFEPEESAVLGIKLDMSIEDVKTILGEPIDERKEPNEALGGDSVFLHYPSLELSFDPYIREDNTESYSLSAITVKGSDISGPRGLKVGDSAESVLDKFPNENHAIEDGTQILYGGDYDLMEHGFVYYDEGENIECISYLYGGGGFGTYALNYFVEDGKVKEIQINVANI